jgi:integrase
MQRRKGTGKERKTLMKIQYYPSPGEIYSKLISRKGWIYKEKADFFIKRDRALAALLYLGALRISEVIRIRKNQLLDRGTHILIQGVKLSKSRVKGRPRRVEYRDVQLPLSGPRESLSHLILDYVDILGSEDRLFPFSLEKNERGQIVGCKRAWQIVKALLPEFTAHWLRAFGEEFLYGEWDHDLLALSDYIKVDPRTLQEYIRKRHEKYRVV